jgi:hypothetical protein
MRNLTAITFLGGLAASIATGGCSSGAEGSSGEGHGSTSGIDGGDVGSGSVTSAGGDLLGGGSTLGFGTGGTSGAGGTTSAGSATSAGGAASAGATASGGAHGGPITVVTPVGTTDAVCANQSVSASAGILDIFIMLDRSKSMADDSGGGTKWEVITQALETFVKAPESASMNAGIGFFGIPTGSGNRATDSSCTVADYAKPVVPIGLLGGATGNGVKIATAIQAVNPTTNTPTEPALRGALDYSTAWAKQHPTHKVVVVFATDGLPNGCDSTVGGAAKIAATGITSNPSIQTYVIGVFGDDDCPGGVTKGQACSVVTNTNQIAKSGGTGSAFIVNASASTGEQFLAALNAIRAANQVGCDFKVPAPAKGKAIDFSRATVRYTPGKGAAETLSWKAASAQCGTAGGWYYNSDTAPNQVLLCDATCKTVMADVAAKVDVVLACQPPGTNTGSGGTGNGVGGTGSAGTPGAGGTASGAGGTTSGAGGATSGAGGADSCLLAGQSCQSAAECCGGLCTNGVCGSNIR